MKLTKVMTQFLRPTPAKNFSRVPIISIAWSISWVTCFSTGMASAAEQPAMVSVASPNDEVRMKIESALNDSSNQIHDCILKVPFKSLKLENRQVGYDFDLVIQNRLPSFKRLKDSPASAAQASASNGQTPFPLEHVAKCVETVVTTKVKRKRIDVPDGDYKVFVGVFAYKKR